MIPIAIDLNRYSTIQLLFYFLRNIPFEISTTLNFGVYKIPSYPMILKTFKSNCISEGLSFIQPLRRHWVKDRMIYTVIKQPYINKIDWTGFNVLYLYHNQILSSVPTTLVKIDAYISYNLRAISASINNKPSNRYCTTYSTKKTQLIHTEILPQSIPRKKVR